MVSSEFEAGTQSWISAEGERTGRERRASPRYASTLQRAWLGWTEGGEFRRVPCWFRDISTSGCLIGLHEGSVPPVVFVHLDGPCLPIWYEARVLEVMPEERPGFWSARVSFPGSCPYDLFMAVAYGRSSREPVAIEPPARMAAEAEDRAPDVSTRGTATAERSAWQSFRSGTRGAGRP